MHAYSGPRKLTPTETRLVKQHLDANPVKGPVGVGDAKGLDALVARHYEGRTDLTIYHVEGRQRWHYAQRSQRMIDNATELTAYPNKPCPPTCTPTKPFSGHGSGTWGTIAYAVKKGLKVTIYPLDGSQVPSWAEQKQLTLI
ncbi:hypothetical protein FEK30_00070 (plasmid) [Picosynechococcus sp. PCC 11901]|uniref:hypothetical protein n=1 Tax=Picosynechococcus sp. PCC 11901 TaxID=2579791 RepID=UPI0010FBF712|nr:hypothetical protein [Picosynechococcus sp. PCC 11901]QCS47967.1 hypothetical protein FEK30_00070 [Picosynechococcus sp. PCC 11901]